MSKPFRWPETQTDPRTGIYEAFVDQTKKEIRKLLRDDQVNGEMRKLIREGGCRPLIQAMTIRKLNAYIDEIARFTVAR